MSRGRITCIPAAIARLSHPDLSLSAPPGGVDTHHVPDIWEQPIVTTLSSSWLLHPSFPVAVEATGLMGTAYLHTVPYQIVDTKRYPRYENIFLLLNTDIGLHGPPSLPPLG